MSALATLGALESITGGGAQGGFTEAFGGNSEGRVGTGSKTFNIGANPNLQQVTQTIPTVALVVVVIMLLSSSKKS